MANKILFPIRWNDLPDPRPATAEGATAVVELHEAEWRKVVQKHFTNSKEPWGETLGQTVLSDVVAGDAADAMRTALEVIHNQCAATLRRPLVILYSCLGLRISGQGHRWLLILPCGALAIVWAEKLSNRLKTCYFTGAVAVKPREKRWRHALRQQVQEYATFDDQARVYRNPAGNERREVSVVGGTCELRYAIRFNAADAWGFASSETGAEWRSPKWDWSTVGRDSSSRPVQTAVNPEDA